MDENENTSPAPPAATMKGERPLSPHLQIYRPQLTAVMSIFHKITGIGLAAGLVVFVAWLVSLAMGREFYTQYMTFLTTPIAKIFYFGWTWAFFYHFSNGIRHLLWALGWCLSLPCVYASGYLVLLFSFGMTLGLWALLLGVV